jgi:ABC-2 type transport system ATP-binding protein
LIFAHDFIRKVCNFSASCGKELALTDVAAPMVAIGGVTKRYGRTLALDAVSFAVQPNELFALRGPNGAGKTTLLHILCAILKPDSGSAAINGVGVVAHPREARRHLGIVFQEAASWRRR